MIDYIPGSARDPVYCAAMTAFDEFDKIRVEEGLPRKSRDKTDPRKPRNGVKRFYELAGICIANAWNEREYVRTVFYALGKPARYVTGKDLVSDKALEIFARRRDDGAHKPSTEGTMYYNRVLADVMTTEGYIGKTPSEILNDPNLDIFPGWFKSYILGG